ncbi:MAG: glycosyltransferase family 4 protein [Nonlabens sp.]|uniref:glycosyltransferase family 4 protein n=1 Tax=Nonlabens sp. TaxID=1888209 RepID=UPI003EF3A28E
MKKKSIAFLIGSLGSGGAERVVSTLCNELAEKYKVTVITFAKKEPFYKLDPKINQIYCLDKIEPSNTFLDTIRLNLKLLKTIKEKLQNENIELIIGFLTRGNILAVLAAKACKIPVIISERNNPYTVKLSLLWKTLWKYTYPKADCLVVQTKIIKQYFKPFVKEESLKILANPISTELTLARNKKITKKKVILNVGRLADQKAQSLLIKAFSALNTEDWYLHIIGKGPKQKEYENMISELGMQERIKLLPPTKSISNHYNSCSIFAFTSIYEGFPNALIEAMHFGLPCIATDCPTGPSELIKNGENGFLIEMNNQKQLEDKLNVLMNNETIRNNFSIKAEKSVEKFQAIHIANDWEQIILKIMK